MKNSLSDRNRVLEEKPVRTHSIELPLRYVRSARVDETTIFDFPNKTLIVEFREPMRVTSTLEGERKGITAVGNHYFPPPCWSIEYRLGLKKWKEHIFKTIGKTQESCCLLFTGADMENLSVQKAQFKDMDSLCSCNGRGRRAMPCACQWMRGRSMNPGP